MTARQIWGVLILITLVGATILIARPRRETTRFALSPPATTTGYRPGEIAPNFALHSLDGGTVRLTNFRGHVVLINFWATWCAPCRVEMPWLVGFDRQYRARGLQVIGVNLDDAGTSRAAIAAFARERGVSYPVLLGDNGVANAYGGVRFMPQTFLIAPDGKVLRSSYGITTRDDFEQNIKDALAQSGR